MNQNAAETYDVLKEKAATACHRQLDLWRALIDAFDAGHISIGDAATLIFLGSYEHTDRPSPDAAIHALDEWRSRISAYDDRPETRRT